MTLRFIPQLNFGVQKVLNGSQKFKLRIMERETRFYEKVEINEDEQSAHFHVPPHNGLAETDELFDFEMVGDSKHVGYFHMQYLICWRTFKLYLMSAEYCDSSLERRLLRAASARRLSEAKRAEDRFQEGNVYCCCCCCRLSLLLSLIF